jgi:nucleoside phosphorylase/tetratricopeptide (TPR) repeat protein
MTGRRLRREDYTIGWVCALHIELAAAQEMLDEEHEKLHQDANDTNIYTLGRIGKHNVVIACLPEGQTGTNSAAAVAVQMKSAFQSVRFGLMVGIGGGVPSEEADIRLGDVVVSTPYKGHGGVVQYDFGKATPIGFDQTGFLNAPPTILLSAVTNLRANLDRGRCRLLESFSKLDSLPTFAREDAGPDILFKADYIHVGGAACGKCSKERVLARQPRKQKVVVHYGTIASGNQVMRDGVERDRVSAGLGGVLCFEMEAAGLMNSFPCLVIRGICDYADSHKNKKWQAYAAGTAAAYAKEVLSVISPAEVVKARTVDETIKATSDSQRRARDYAGQFSHSSLEPVKAYVPRTLLRDQIRTQLCNDAADESTKTLVVWGLGGAGKTQLVLDYVRQYRTDYKTRFWIEAGRKESLERDFVDLYQTLFGMQMVTRKEMVSVDNAVIGVKSWFSGRQGPWLMVFDGADTIENEEAREYIDIKHFIPDVASLHVIVTSRSGTAKDMTRLEGVRVGEMEEAQAAELFYRYSQLQRDNHSIEDEIKAIVKELGHLALAVTLAATYVGRTPRLQSNIKIYLPEYRRRRHELLSRKPERLIHQYSESVLTTWETSYQAVEDQYPEASILMTILSFLSFDDIPLQLFGVDRRTESTVSTDDVAGITWRSIISPGQTVDIYKIEECFEMLQRYSFVQWKKDRQSYAMHKLVHAWGYDRLTGNEQHKFSLATFRLIVEAIEGCGKAPEEKLRLVPHIMSNFTMLAGASGGSNRITEGTLDELEWVGVFITDLGRYSEGRVIQEFVLNRRSRLFGEEHPSTISAMNNLANTLGDQGQLDEAAKMFKEVLEKRKRILGEEHPDTISAMNNLANTLGDQGQIDEAAKMLKGVLEMRKHILGEEHPSTISAMNNLASTLGDQGQLDEAIPLLEVAVQRMRRIHGDEHPHTKVAVSNLTRLAVVRTRSRKVTTMNSKKEE